MSLKIVVMMGGAQKEGKRVLRPSRLPALKRVVDFFGLAQSRGVLVELVFWEKKEAAASEPLYAPLLQAFPNQSSLLVDPSREDLEALMAEVARGVSLCLADFGGVIETPSRSQNSFEMLPTLGLPPNQENITFYDYSTERPLDLEKCLEFYDSGSGQVFRPLYDLGGGEALAGDLPVKDAVYVHRTMRALLAAGEGFSQGPAQGQGQGKKDYFVLRAEAVAVVIGREDTKAFALAFMRRNGIESVQAWEKEIARLVKLRS